MKAWNIFFIILSSFSGIVNGSFEVFAQRNSRETHRHTLLSGKKEGFLYFLNGDTVATSFLVDFYRGFIYTNFQLPPTETWRDRN